MNFSESQLRPPQTGFLSAKSVAYRVPHTPFWNDASRNGGPTTRSFYGNDFFLQNKSTIEFEEDLPDNPGEPRFVSDDPICGFAAYSLSTTVGYGLSEDESGTRELVYVFDETENEVRIETIAVGGEASGGFNTRTATTSISDNQYEDDPDEVAYATVTLSGAVNKTTLGDYLDEWRSKSEEFRSFTDEFGRDGRATKSESDGYLAVVGGGDVQALPYTFNAFSASGMTGDIAALWNGNFTAEVSRVTRKNDPVIYREQSEGHTYEVTFLSIGSNIYRNGYSEESVSDPITSYRDDYGIFEDGEGLENSPLFSSSAYTIGDLAYYDVDGYENSVFFISRDGKQYRLTFRDYENSTTEVLITDANTLKSPEITIETSVGLQKIEQKVEGDWVVLADIENGDNPQNLIGYSVRDTNTRLFAVIRRRQGSRYGFFALGTIGGTRYRVKSYKIHLTPETVILDDGACGDDVSGSYDAEWYEEYDAVTGLLKPRVVTEWAAVINGEDWTPEDAPSNVSFSGSTLVTSTATLRRREGESTTSGRFIVAFDSPNSNGKIISTSTFSAAVSFTGGINVSEEVALLPPASGRSVFFEGFRLRE
jgi:hypothetical protein